MIGGETIEEIWALFAFVFAKSVQISINSLANFIVSTPFGCVDRFNMRVVVPATSFEYTGVLSSLKKLSRRPRISRKTVS